MPVLAGDAAQLQLRPGLPRGRRALRQNVAANDDVVRGGAELADDDRGVDDIVVAVLVGGDQVGDGVG
ncbi:MAG: hypothetical protein IPK78_00610 [Rhodospirillales bacterium]|nr:hypothetical protein [Rhodospirillales bacterium]